jgi:hypothetical protein
MVSMAVLLSCGCHDDEIRRADSSRIVLGAGAGDSV